MVTPSSPRPTTSMPVMAPALEGHVQACGQTVAAGLRGAHVGADRHVHADIAAAAERVAPMAKPMAGAMPSRNGHDHQDHHADEADRQVLAVEVGARALLNRRTDFLHARGARVRCQHLARGERAVAERHHPARANGKISQHSHSSPGPCSGRWRAPRRGGGTWQTGFGRATGARATRRGLKLAPGP